MAEGGTWQLGKMGAGVVAFVLWLITAVVGLVEIYVVRVMVLRVYARFFADSRAYGADYWGGITLGNFLTVILAVVWIGVVIGFGEYHYRRVGQPKSWRLFARTLAFQFSILVLALFI